MAIPGDPPPPTATFGPSRTYGCSYGRGYHLVGAYYVPGMEVSIPHVSPHFPLPALESRKPSFRERRPTLCHFSYSCWLPGSTRKYLEVIIISGSVSEPTRCPTLSRQLSAYVTLLPAWQHRHKGGCCDPHFAAEGTVPHQDEVPFPTSHTPHTAGPEATRRSL